MRFVKTEGTTELEQALTEALMEYLRADKRVVWLVPGGSNVAVVVRVVHALRGQNLQNLTLMLTDERYGEPGHKDSNYFQLRQAGLEPGIAFTDILQGLNLEETVTAAESATSEAFKRADIVIGFFGMGADGHIAGILPHSPAATAEERWVVGYDGGQYQRITLTPFALSHIETAFVGAYGAEKKLALETLCNQALSMAEQPARILCHLPDVTVFNDQIGDES